MRVTASGSFRASSGIPCRSWLPGESSLSFRSRGVLPLCGCTEKLSEHQDAPSAPDASSKVQGHSGVHRLHSLAIRCKILDKAGIQTILKVFPNITKDPMWDDYRDTVLTWHCRACHLSSTPAQHFHPGPSVYGPLQDPLDISTVFG